MTLTSWIMLVVFLATTIYISPIQCAINNTAAFNSTDHFDIPQMALGTNGAATPYSSNITVFGIGVLLPGEYPWLNIFNLTHDYPDDVTMVLTSPLGKSIMFLSDCGGRTPCSGIDLYFRENDIATANVPDNSPLYSGVFLPTNIHGSIPLDAPGPQSCQDYSLRIFTGDNADGVWQLWVFDDNHYDSGMFDGWQLIFPQRYPSPSASPSPFLTPSLSPSPVATATATYTRTESASISRTGSDSRSLSNSISPSGSNSFSPSGSISASGSTSRSRTPSVTPSTTKSLSSSPSRSQSSTNSQSGSSRPTPSNTPSNTPSISVSAVRCGNGRLDDGEECDASINKDPCCEPSTCKWLYETQCGQQKNDCWTIPKCTTDHKCVSYQREVDCSCVRRRGVGVCKIEGYCRQLKR